MTDLFTDKTEPQTTVVTTTVVEADPLLATIVNEDGKPKYASVQDALKALASSQAHIKTLESENSQLRDAKTTALTLEEVLKAIKPAEGIPTQVVPPKQPEQIDITTLVANSLAKIETEKNATANVTIVVDKMKELYRDAASTTFYSKAKELGFDQEDINSLASKNPKAVLKLFGIEDKKATKIPQGSIRTEAFVNNTKTTSQKGGMAFGNTSDLVAEWRRVTTKVNQELGIN